MNKSQNNKKLDLILRKIIKIKGDFKISSKDIKSGDIFITLKGSKDHGENYIKDAINNGAKIVISEKLLLKHKDKIIKVDNCNKILKLIAHKKRSKYKGTVIGVTGSVGKTSTKEQLKYFLSKEIKTYASTKSYNNQLGLNLSLANLNLNSSVAVFEIGTSNFGEISCLTKILKPNIAIVTNIGPAHLEFFKNINNIKKEKSEIFNTKYNTDLRFVIVPYNINKNSLFKRAKLNKKYKIISFGNKKGSNIYLKNMSKLKDNRYQVKAQIFKKKIKYLISAKGDHQITNSLISLAVFDALNLKLNKIKKFAQHLPELSGRGKLYNLKLKDKKIIFIDESYNASPMSMEATINYFANYNKNKLNHKFLILGDMLELGKKSISFHIKISKYLKLENFYQIITCGSYIKFLYRIYNKSKKNIFYFKNLDALNKHILKYINHNDVILAKGSNSSLINKFALELKQKGTY